MIKIICIFLILLLIIFHVLKTKRSAVVIDSNATKGAKLDDIENTLSSTHVHTSVEEPSESVDAVHPKRKQGWCLVGTDRGNRSCLRVGVNDYCHSQHIYPTRDVCINPNLRF